MLVLQRILQRIFAVTVLFLTPLFLIFLMQTKLASAAQTIPYKINFQGRLTNSNGNIVANGLYNIRFTIYDASTGGTNIWQETRETSSRVQITNGLFDVRFGDVTALSPTLFNSNAQLYLEVELPTPATATCSGGGCASYTEGPLSPRQPIAASPYAFNADLIDGLDGSQLARVDAGNTFTGNQVVNGQLSATTILQGGSTVCDYSNNCNYAGASGSTGYIQNGTNPQTANFNITGNAIIGGNLSIAGALKQNGNDVCTTVGNCQSSLQNAYEGGNTLQLTDAHGSLQITNEEDKKMLFLDYVTGSIGVGTTTPTAKLHVVGGGTGEATLGNTVDMTADDITALAFKPDGIMAYGVNPVTREVIQYNLSTPWDLDTADYDAVSPEISNALTSVFSVSFSSNGRYMYVSLFSISPGGDAGIAWYELDTPWDVSTAEYHDITVFDNGEDAIVANSFIINSAGTKAYALGVLDSTLYQYRLAIPWDLNSYSLEDTLDIGEDAIEPIAAVFNASGTKLYVLHNDSLLERTKIDHYQFDTPWNLSTATHQPESIDFGVSLDTYSLAVSLNGTRMYVPDQGVVYQVDIDDLTAASITGRLEVSGTSSFNGGLFANGAEVCTTSNNCNFAPASNSGSYIQNSAVHNGSMQEGNINLTGISGTGLPTMALRGSSDQLTPILQASSSGWVQVFTIGHDGAVKIQTATNSTTALSVRTDAGQSVFNVDTATPSITLGVGGSAFSGIKKQTVAWNPSSTANGTSSTNAYTLSVAGAVVMGVKSPGNGPTCNGSGCQYTWQQLDATNSANPVIEFKFNNGSTTAQDPASGNWEIWYLVQ